MRIRNANSEGVTGGTTGVAAVNAHNGKLDVVAETNNSGEFDKMFEPLYLEHDYYLEDTAGSLPEGLVGTLYRNNAGKFEAGGERVSNFTDGEGMLAMYAFDGERVRFRNRYVETTHFMSGKSARGTGTQRQGGIFANILRAPASRGNTNAVLQSGELLAMYETDKPYVLDPDSLDTRGKQDFYGELGSPIWAGSFSAHPKTDPETGDMYNFGFEMFPRPMLRCYKLSKSGRLDHLHNVHLPQVMWNHDFALTKRYLVFVLDPLIIDARGVAKYLLGLDSFDNLIDFKPTAGTTVVLVPRDGGTARVMQTDALFHFHVTNAFDDGADVVVELCEWFDPWKEVNKGLRAYDHFPTVGWNTGGVITHLRITSEGRVLQDRLSDTRGEWPQFDWRRCCSKHRYGYMAARAGKNLSANSILKVDNQTGAESSHILPDGQHASEPVFVPRSRNAAEDDGWLLTQVYDPSVHRSRILVLDAKTPERDPIFVGYLKHHIPWSYHGSFTRRIARPGPLVPPRDVRLRRGARLTR